MERFAIWFGLLLKKNLCRKTVYIQSAVLIFLLIFIQNIHMPDNENLKIGIYYDDSTYAERIYDDLVYQNNVYDYLMYKDLKTLEKDVTAGKVECGFVFSDDFDDDFEKGSVKKTVTFLCTPMSAKGELIKENFYIAFFKNFSEIILKESEKELYETSDKERQQEILEWNGIYLNSDEVFKMEVRNVETTQKSEEKSVKSEVYPIQGIYGVILFLFTYFSYNGRKKYNAGDFRSVLNKADGFVYDILDGFTAGLFPMLSGVIVILLSPCSRGSVIETVGALLVFLLNIVWIIVFFTLCKKEINYMSAMLVVVILQVLLCPVFWDFTEYFGSVEYFRYMFPLGFYLSL